MGATKTASECAALVVRKEPEADGVQFGVKAKAGKCIAVFESSGHPKAWDWEQYEKDVNWISCLLEGVSINAILHLNT